MVQSCSCRQWPRCHPECTLRYTPPTPLATEPCTIAHSVESHVLRNTETSPLWPLSVCMQLSVRTEYVGDECFVGEGAALQLHAMFSSEHVRTLSVCVCVCSCMPVCTNSF